MAFVIYVIFRRGLHQRTMPLFIKALTHNIHRRGYVLKGYSVYRIHMTRFCLLGKYLFTNRPLITHLYTDFLSVLTFTSLSVRLPTSTLALY